MGCVGDGWHRVGTNCKVFVNDRVITECLKLVDGEWQFATIRRWNQTYHWYERTGRVTLAAFRSGLARGTMTFH